MITTAMNEIEIESESFDDEVTVEDADGFNDDMVADDIFDLEYILDELELQNPNTPNALLEHMENF